MDDPSAPSTIPEGYTSWAAIAGFFDGDGCVEVDARVYTLHWVISFSDNWPKQVEQIRDFLIKRGMRVGKTKRNGIGGWTCQVVEISSLRAVANEMLQSGGIFKKKRELQLLLDYFSDKINGTNVLEAFNSEVRLGIRTGKIRRVDMPYTYSEGYARARYAPRPNQRTLSETESRKLVDEFLSSQLTGKSLAKKFGVSKATVSRILKGAGVDVRGRRKSSSTRNKMP